MSPQPVEWSVSLFTVLILYRLSNQAIEQGEGSQTGHLTILKVLIDD
jgi:hypothetical protein